MKKTASILLLMTLVLSGCTQVSGDLNGRVKKSIADALALPASQANRNKTFYSYYIEPSVGRYSGNNTGNVFTYEGAKFLMNLNVPVIINEDAYPQSTADGIESIADPVVDQSGTYLDSSEINHTYRLRIYQQDAVFLTALNTDTVKFYAVTDQVKAADLAGEMLKIAKSVEVNEKTVLAAYTNHQTLNYETEKVQLYNEVVPESGAVSDLINDTNTIGNSTTNSQDAAQGQSNSDNQK